MTWEELEESWRSRWRLWTSVLRLWRAELRVRISVARWCLAIYRREVLEHKYETALLEADRWECEGEELGNGWDELGDLPAEDCVTGGVLGIPWHVWGRRSVISWLLLIPASWSSVFLAWAGMKLLGYACIFLWLGLATAWNGMPGAAALLSPEVRGRLLFMPEAAALASLSLSAAVGLAGGLMATCLHLEMSVSVALAGIVFGIIFFPLSFGLIFPLAIPLLCCFMVWRVAKSWGRIPRAGYALLTGVSAAGWLGVAVIGPAVGLGG